MRAPRLLIVGGGHASLPLLAHARTLVRATGAEVTLVSDRPELWYSGMTPEWLGGVYTRGQVTVPLGPICEREGVRFVQGRAEALDRGARTVRLADGSAVPYDLVAFDVGAVNPGAPGGDVVHTKPLWRIEALGAFLDGVAAGGSGRLVVVGGGAAGAECALNVTARPDLGGLSVVVVEPSDRLCAGLPERLGEGVRQTLEARGARVVFGERADAVTEGAVRLGSGATIPADAVLWATGSVGPPLFARAGLPVTDEGFVRVDRGLRSVADPRVFVAGDAASVKGHEGLARIGVHAVKQGPVLRTNVGRAVWALARDADPAKADLVRFRPYPLAPLLISTGTAEAWGVVGTVALRGGPLLRLKHAVDRRWIARYAPAAFGSRWDARAASAGG